MGGFTARIELRGAVSGDYTRLDAEMAKQGFVRTIIANDGSAYELPSGEYIYDYTVQVTRLQVLEKAMIAARRVKKPFAILVSVSDSWAWAGLKELGHRH